MAGLPIVGDPKYGIAAEAMRRQRQQHRKEKQEAEGEGRASLT